MLIYSVNFISRKDQVETSGNLIRVLFLLAYHGQAARRVSFGFRRPGRIGTHPSVPKTSNPLMLRPNSSAN